MKMDISKEINKFKKMLNDKTIIKVYQAYLMILTTAISSILITYIIIHPRKYIVIDNNDVRTEAYSCYETFDELRCYVDTKVKQYGRLK